LAIIAKQTAKKPGTKDPEPENTLPKSLRRTRTDQRRAAVFIRSGMTGCKGVSANGASRKSQITDDDGALSSPGFMP